MSWMREDAGTGLVSSAFATMTGSHCPASYRCGRRAGGLGGQERVSCSSVADIGFSSSLGPVRYWPCTNVKSSLLCSSRSNVNVVEAPAAVAVAPIR